MVKTEAETEVAIDGLRSKGLLAVDSAGELLHTDKGSQLFASRSKAVESITASLYGDLPQSDLEATHRTLLEIGSRAAKLLAEK